MFDEQRLTMWKASLEAVTARALRDIVSTLPFELGTHIAGQPASEAELAALKSRLPWIPDDLLAVCRWVGAVSLPDIANGYFLFEPRHILGMLDHEDGIPHSIAEPFDEAVDVVVFGSDGGGTLYALAVNAAGTVYRLRECAYQGGAYYGTAGFGVIEVAESLDDFLDKFLAAVSQFADDGSIADL
jgi:hypothetical protein